MSMIETVSDVKNNLLSRREITCTIRGLAGKLKKLEAIDMISKQYKLEGKVIVPIRLRNETGRPLISGTFYVYDDEKLAMEHIKPAIFKRLEKAKGGGEKKEVEVKEEKVEKSQAKGSDKKDVETKEAKPKETKAEKPQVKDSDKKEKPAKKEAPEAPKEKSK